MLKTEMHRWRSWATRAGEVAFAQLLVQLINAVTGFLIVRSLAKTDYAWFTIINTVAATLATVGDSGLSTGLLSTAGRVWQDRPKFSQLVTTALRLRMRVVTIAASATLPWGFWMLAKNDTPWPLACGLLAVSLLGGVPSATGMVMGVVPRLRSEVRVQQVWDLIAAVLRLGLSALALRLCPMTLPLIAIVTFTQWVQFALVRRHVAQAVDLTALPAAEYRRDLLASLKSLWFPSLFTCFQAQIGTFILSLGGMTSSVADLGALSRFSVVFSVVGSVLFHLAAPAFARSQSSRALLGSYLRSFLGVLAVCTLLTLLAWMFPGVLLWIVGPRYSHMTRELPLLFLVQSLGMVVTLTWYLASARGWINLSWIIPLATLAFQGALLAFLDVRSVNGTLWFMLWSQIPTLIVVLIMVWRGLRNWPPSPALE